MAKQKINKSKNTALESHKKSDKAKWAITFISLILIATLLGGLSFYIVNNNKTSNPPAIEQGQGQTEGPVSGRQGGYAGPAGRAKAVFKNCVERRKTACF